MIRSRRHKVAFRQQEGRWIERIEDVPVAPSLFSCLLNGGQPAMAECQDCGAALPTQTRGAPRKRCPECNRERQREYRERPEVRARNREYEREYNKRPEVKARRRLRMKLDRVLARVLRETRAPDDMRFRLAVKLITGIADDPAHVLARLRRTIVSGSEKE